MVRWLREEVSEGMAYRDKEKEKEAIRERVRCYMVK